MFKIVVVPSVELTEEQLKSLYNTDRKKYNRLRMRQYRTKYKDTKEYKQRKAISDKKYNKNMSKEVRDNINKKERERFKNASPEKRQKLKNYLNKHRRNASQERKKYLAEKKNREYHNLSLEEQRARRERQRSKRTKEQISKDKDYHKEYKKNYTPKVTTEQRRIYHRNRRVRKNNIIEDFSSKEWLQKLKDTFGVCPKCNKYVGIAHLTIDHIFPISKAEAGRIYTIDDVQPLCNICNSIKGVKVK